jgi:hypothetical protein
MLATGALAGAGACGRACPHSDRAFSVAGWPSGGESPGAAHAAGGVDDNAITMAWLGHATVLVNFHGLRIITDPVLFDRIGVDLGIGSLGPLRLVQCALTPEELPDIDLVLISTRPPILDTPSLAPSAARRPLSWRWQHPTCCRAASTRRFTSFAGTNRQR